MLDSILMVKKKDKVVSTESMVVNMKEISYRTPYMEKVHILGLMAENMQVIGKIIKCMERESLLGLMEENIKVNYQIYLLIKIFLNFIKQVSTLMIRSTDMESLSGLMDVNTMEIGKMENNMVEEFM